MPGIGIGIGIELTPPVIAAAGPAEVTVTEVGVMSFVPPEEWTVRATFSHNVDASNGTLDLDFGAGGAGSAGSGSITATGATWVEYSVISEDFPPLTYLLSTEHGFTSPSGPIASGQTGDVIQLP